MERQSRCGCGVIQAIIVVISKTVDDSIAGSIQSTCFKRVCKTVVVRVIIEVVGYTVFVGVCNSRSLNGIVNPITISVNTAELFNVIVVVNTVIICINTTVAGFYSIWNSVVVRVKIEVVGYAVLV